VTSLWEDGATKVEKERRLFLHVPLPSHHFYYFSSLTDHLPDNLIPDPRQTINFKFGEITLIVDDGQNVVFFNRKNYVSETVSIIAIHEGLQIQLQLVLSPLETFVCSLKICFLCSSKFNLY